MTGRLRWNTHLSLRRLDYAAHSKDWPGSVSFETDSQIAIAPQISHKTLTLSPCFEKDLYRFGNCLGNCMYLDLEGVPQDSPHL